MAYFTVFKKENNGVEVETGISLDWFRFEEDSVIMDYHSINSKITVGVEFFITRAAAEDINQPPTGHRFIKIDSPDWDLDETLSRDFLNDAILSYSNNEFDLTGAEGATKNYSNPVDFGTVKANQTKIFNKTVGQVFNIGATSASFDFKFNFKLGSNVGTPTGNLTVKLWSLDTNKLPLNELDSIDIAPTENALNTVEFLSAILPKANKYAFTIQDDSTNDTDNSFRIERSEEQIYTSGDYIDNQSGWDKDITLDLCGSFEKR